MSGNRDEFALIEWIRRRARISDRVPLGIGDDAAVVHFPRRADCLVAVDVLMEGVHFRSPPATPRDVGRKALAVNLSDIAAMAGRPLAAVVGVVLPRGRGDGFAEELHEGLRLLAEEFHVVLAGGDTNAWDGPLVLSVTVLGETTERGPVTRRGAQVGDWILATGTFGGSLAGKHLTFRPRVEEALELHALARLHALIDVSDGLAADVRHIAEESGVGVVLDAQAIPLSDAARECRDGRSPLEHALSDGEDFELLAAVAPEDAARLLAEWRFETPLTRIGEIVPAGTWALRDAAGGLAPLPGTGWRHTW